MHNWKFVRLLALSTLLLPLFGCSIAPQTLFLDDESGLAETQAGQGKSALARVLDKRQNKQDNELGIVGVQGGKEAPVLSAQPLTKVLTAKLTASLESLGFGSGAIVPGQEPLKVQLDIEAFDYRCQPGKALNKCYLEMGWRLTLIRPESTFNKSFQLNESREVLLWPEYRYNQEWVNDAMNRLWQRTFSNSEVLEQLD